MLFAAAVRQDFLRENIEKNKNKRPARITTDKRNMSTENNEQEYRKRKNNEEKDQCSYFRSSNDDVFMCMFKRVQRRLRRESKSRLQRWNVRQLLQLVCRV